MNSIKQKTISGAKWVAVSAAVCAILQLLKLAILARYIPKVDFGLFATVAAILGLADFFVEAGLGSAIIHKQDANNDELASAYTINLFLGLLVFSVLYYTRGIVSDFYSDLRLKNLIAISAVVFLIQPIGRQYDALFRRDFNFRILAKIDILSVIIGFCSSVVLAFYGFGVEALIYSQLAMVLIKTFCLFVKGSENFGFRLGFSWASAKFFFRFGLFQVFRETLNYLNAQFDVIIIGKLLGQENLGIFFLTKQLATRPGNIVNPIINKVALPAFAKFQNDTVRLKKAYLQIVHFLAFIHFGLLFLITAFSKEIVLIFLGENWVEASSLLKILCYYSMARVIINPLGNLLVAKGRVDSGFYWNFLMLFYYPPVIFLSSMWGGEGVAWGLFVSTALLNFPVWFFFVKKFCNANFLEYFGQIIFNAAISFVCFWPIDYAEVVWLKILLSTISLSLYLKIFWPYLKLLRKP